MIDDLYVLNLPSAGNCHNISQQELVDQLENKGHFVLRTCQRNLIVSFNTEIKKYRDCGEFYSGEESYEFLLQTLCGLKSRLLGENEIAGQFKTSYRQYGQCNKRNPLLMSILELLLKDGKKIRTQYLQNVGQYSYSGITKKLLFQKKAPAGEKRKVLILGSGNMARDLVTTLSREFDLYVSARNEEKREELRKKGSFKVIPWGDLVQYSKFSFVICTIGAQETLLGRDFFNSWQSDNTKNRLFVDLGSPSVLATDFGVENGLYRLEDIFQLGQELGAEKIKVVREANQAISNLVQERKNKFSVSLPFGWEDLQFV